MPVTYFWIVNYVPLKSQPVEIDYSYYWHTSNILERTEMQEAYNLRERLSSRTSLLENTISETFNQNKEFFFKWVMTPLLINMTLQTRKAGFYQLHRITITFKTNTFTKLTSSQRRNKPFKKVLSIMPLKFTIFLFSSLTY